MTKVEYFYDDDMTALVSRMKELSDKTRFRVDNILPEHKLFTVLRLEYNFESDINEKDSHNE